MQVRECMLVLGLAARVLVAIVSPPARDGGGTRQGGWTVMTAGVLVYAAEVARVKHAGAVLLRESSPHACHFVGSRARFTRFARFSLSVQP